MPSNKQLIEALNRAEAAERRVAALYRAGNLFYREVYAEEVGADPQASTKDLHEAAKCLSSAEYGARVYEARIRADERRKVYVEERDRLIKLANDYLRARDPGYDKGEDYFELLDQRNYFEEQLAALDAPGDGEGK